MPFDRRHVLLAGAATLAGGTVAAASLWRKPETPPIATLIDSPAPGLRPLGQIQPAETPAPPAAASFTDAEGTPQTLATYAGMGLVVNLWATWCAPCVAEMPALRDLATKLKREGILVLPLSSDRGGTAQVKKFYDAHAITNLPILLDPKGEAGRAWGARGLPTTLLIDRTGRERARLEGAFDWSSDAAVATIRRLVG